MRVAAILIIFQFSILYPLTTLGEFAKLRIATISFVVSVHPFVRPSVRTEQLDSQWTDFHKFLFEDFFRKSVKKIQVSLKSDKNSGNLA